MLHEIQLLVRRGRPEILPVVGQIVFFLLAFLVGETHRAFLTERRIRQHVIEAFTGIRHQRIIRGNHAVAVDLADIVQKHIHQREAPRIGDNLIAVKCLVLQKRFLRFIQRIFGHQKIVRRQKEAARAA